VQDRQLVMAPLTCPDCGEDYDAQLFMGEVTSKRCDGCSNKRARALEIVRLQRDEKTLEYRRQEWLSAAVGGIPRRYRDVTWEDFKYDQGGEGNRGKVAALREYAETFPAAGWPFGTKSLVIARDVNGVGKTMLGCLILREIIMRYEGSGWERAPFQFWPSDAVKFRLKAAERFGGGESVEDVYRDFASMSLLVLDDVGKEKLVGADAAQSYEMYFNILNTRYNEQLPVILTSNLKYEPWEPDGMSLVDLMGRAGVSRLMEMTEGAIYIIEGPDRRYRKTDCNLSCSASPSV